MLGNNKIQRVYSRFVLTLMISFIITFSIDHCQYHRSLIAAYAEEKAKRLDNILLSVTYNNNDIFGNIAKQLGSFAKQLEYSIDLDGKQIFPNDAVKQDIVTNYKSSDYNISNLKYRLLGFDISASDIRIHVNPSKIDTTRTKIDFPLIFARNVTVSNGLINLNYEEINLGSIYGIYDKTTDKLTMHIPINIALQYVPHNI